MNIFAAIFCYSISKFAADPDGFIAAEVAAGEKAEWPCFRTLGRLRSIVGPLQLLVDRATLVAKARSRAAHSFYASDADVWVSIDDDIEVSSKDLGLLLEAMRDPTSDIVIGPCAMRQDKRLNIVAEKRNLRTTSTGVRLLEIDRGGAALMAVSRRAIEVMVRVFPELWWVNAPDDVGLGFFLETIVDSHWMGEDMMFCMRARAAGIRIEALVDTAIVHAGVLATINPDWLTAPEAETVHGRPKPSPGGATNPPAANG